MDPSILAAVAQGAGKRAESLVLAIGSPQPGGQDSALFGLRSAALGGARVAWVEHAADPGCALDDRRQWRKANPGIAAGILFPDVLEVELATVSEAEFRSYRLGQWVDAVMTAWLPGNAWQDCPNMDVPADGTEVVLGLAGGRGPARPPWSAPRWTAACSSPGNRRKTSDDELEAMIEAAGARWRVVELVVAPRQRPNLVARLGAILPVEVWPNQVDIEVKSSTEWRRAIVEGRVAHDHHPTAGRPCRGHGGAVDAGRVVPADRPGGRSARWTRRRAARMAWWRALDAARPVRGARHLLKSLPGLVPGVTMWDMARSRASTRRPAWPAAREAAGTRPPKAPRTPEGFDPATGVTTGKTIVLGTRRGRRPSTAGVTALARTRLALRQFTTNLLHATDGRDVLHNSPDGWEVEQPWLYWTGPPAATAAGGPFGHPIPGAEPWIGVGVDPGGGPGHVAGGRHVGGVAVAGGARPRRAAVPDLAGRPASLTAGRAGRVTGRGGRHPLVVDGLLDAMVDVGVLVR